MRSEGVEGLSKRNRNRRISNKANIVERPSIGEISFSTIYSKFSSYPADGLTPQKLAKIFKQADEGDILQQAELFEQIEEKDPQIFSQLQTRKNAVTGLDFEIIPFGDDDRDKEIAEFISDEIKAIECFEDCLMDALDAIGKGISVQEIIWEQGWDKVSVKEIKWRHPKQFFWDYEDNFKAITRNNPEGVIVPQDKFIIHKYKARSGHPARAGVLRVVAWMYLFKNYSLKDWVSFCEVFGMPLRLGLYDPSASDQDKMDLMNALVRLGTDAAGIIPKSTSIEFKEAAKISSINVYETLSRYCDEQISKAVLGQTLTADSGGGSFAQSKTHDGVRHDLTVADSKALASTLRRDLIRPLVKFNFGEEDRIPYLRFDCEEAEDLKETADMYKVLVCDIGVRIPSSHIYKKFSIPKPEDDEEVVTPPSITSSPTITSLKEDSKVVINKAVSSKISPIAEGQKEIDGLAESAMDKNTDTFKKMFAPILKKVDKCKSLQEVKALYESDKEMKQLLEEMLGTDFEGNLHRSMLLADIKGRMIEDGVK